MGAETPSEDDFDQLVMELEDVRKRGIDRIDGGERSLPRLDLPVVTRCAAAFVGETTASRPVQVRLLLKAATAQLERRGDRDQYRRVALMYGLAKGMAGKQPRELKEVVRAEFGEHKSQSEDKRSQRANRPARQQLARAILSLLGIDGPTEPGELGDERSAPYVRRGRLHERFDRFVHRGAKLIVLVGEPGMGKSVLADALTREHAAVDADIPWLRMEGASLSKPDLYAALAQQEVVSDEPLDGDPRLALARLLCGEQAPPFVVIDNLADTAALHDLLPVTTRSVVVATARTNRRPPDGSRVLKVGRMTDHEVRRLLRAHVPDLDDGQVERVAALFYGYPIVLTYAAHLLSHQTMTVEELCAAVRSQPHAVLDGVPSNATLLTSVLRELVDRIAQDDGQAHRLLACLAILQETYKTSKRFLKRYLAPATEDQAVAAVRYTQALDVLDGFALVETVEERFVMLHPLVHDMLRSLFADDAAQVAEQILTNVLSYRREHADETATAAAEWPYDELWYEKWHVMDICMQVERRADQGDGVPSSLIQAAKQFIAHSHRAAAARLVLTEPCKHTKTEEADEATAMLRQVEQDYPLALVPTTTTVCMECWDEADEVERRRLGTRLLSRDWYNENRRALEYGAK